MKFPRVTLSDCCEFLDHLRRPVKESERISGPYPYFGANGQQGWIDDYLFDEPLVLLAEDGGHFSTPERGIAYKISGKTWVNNHAHVLRPMEGVITVDYLSHALRNKDVRRHLSGSTRDKLTKAGACQIEIPLPPLEKQRRIAAILDKAATMREHANTQLKTAKDLLASAFVETVGDPLKNPNGWSAIPLAEAVQIGTDVTYGIVQAGEEFPGGIPYIRTGDIVDGEIDLSKLRHTDPEIARRFARSTVRTGEIVMSIRATVGTTALVPACLDGANLTQGTARISPGECVNRAYLLQYLRMPSTQAWIQRQVKGATFREITLARLRELPVLIPPMETQEAFAAKSCIVNSITNLAKALLVRTGNLSTSLANQLLT